MARISIDVEDEVHSRLKALAALEGVSMKEFLLRRALRNDAQEDSEALVKLRAFLEARVKSAEENGPSNRSVDEIFQQAYRESETNA